MVRSWFVVPRLWRSTKRGLRIRENSGRVLENPNSHEFGYCPEIYAALY
jgi:hypothetical protein